MLGREYNCKYWTWIWNAEILFLYGRQERTFWRSTPDSGLHHPLTRFWKNWQISVSVCLHMMVQQIEKYTSKCNIYWKVILLWAQDKTCVSELILSFISIQIICTGEHWHNVLHTYNCVSLCLPGYCGADIKAVCSEAALCALRRRYPQIYSSSQKLVLDVNSIAITNKDFMSAMSKMVPASQRYN